MVIFGANHTAERFLDGDRLTAHFPGPGAYDYATRSPAAEVAPVPRRYAEKTLEDGCVRPDGSALLFRGRDSWVRGVDGPKVCQRGYVPYRVLQLLCTRYVSYSSVNRGDLYDVASFPPPVDL